MNIRARVTNTTTTHQVDVATDGRWQSLSIAPKATGRGSSVNGGELLFAALATCFCNDIHREAAKRNILVDDVDVEVSGTFGGPGEPASGVTYLVRVRSNAPQRDVDELIRATDALAEIQNTLRAGCRVQLVNEDERGGGGGSGL